MYRTPATGPRVSTARTDWLAIGGVMVFLAALLSGLAVLLLQTGRTGLVRGEQFNAAFALHQTFAAVFVSAWLVLLHVTGSHTRRSWGWTVAWVVGWVLSLFNGASLTIRIGPVRFLSMARLAVVPLVVMGAIASVHGLVFARREQPWERWVPSLLAALWAAVLGRWCVSDGTAVAAVIESLEIASLAALVDVSEFRANRWRSACLLALLVAPVRWLSGVPPGAMAILTAVHFASGLAFTSVCLRTTRRGSSMHPTWMAWLAVACFTQGILLRGLLSAVTSKVHLAGTLVDTAALHFELLTGVLALLAVFALRAGDRPMRCRRVVSLAVALLAIGVEMLGGSFAAAGMFGMPKRYITFLPRFATTHTVATIGAVLVVVGAIVWLPSVRAARESSGTSAPR